MSNRIQSEIVINGRTVTVELTNSAKMKATRHIIVSKVGRRTKKVVTKDVVTSSPEVDVDGIEDGKEREPPRDTIHNCLLAIREELVYNSTEKKNMDERPL